MENKHYTILGILLLIGGFGLMFWQSQHFVEAQVPVVQETQVEQRVAQAEKVGDLSLIEAVKASDNQSGLTAEKVEIKEIVYTLENEYIVARFTNKGGAIKDISLKKYPLELDSKDAFVFNAETDRPALSIALSNGSLPNVFDPEYELVDVSNSLIRFRYHSPEGLEIIRAYSINDCTPDQDPYVIQHETRFSNKSEQVFDLKRIFMSLGSFPETPGDASGEYLNFSYYDGKSAEFIKMSQFQDSKGIFGIGKREALPFVLKENTKPVQWACVKNQFFATVLSPKSPAMGVFSQATSLISANSTQDGITGSLLFSLGSLSPKESKVLGMSYYVGPKELRRLENLGNNQELIMQFGFFSFISKFLLSIMLIINTFIPNWGLTIITVTVLIKLALWPLTNAQVRSSKRMAALQGPLKAIKEQYANNPQKQQAETMKLFKEHKVNPAAGCLPLLVQIPIFLGLYFMLRTSSELRFAPFLWIQDLSVPDTIFYLSSFPINPLPLLMGITMYYQMKVMPSPSTDDTQRRLFQFMPFIFLFFCYNFPSGLVLYWTVQNILTIAQQVLGAKRVESAIVTAPTSVSKNANNPFKKQK